MLVNSHVRYDMELTLDSFVNARGRISKKYHYSKRIPIDENGDVINSGFIHDKKTILNKAVEILSPQLLGLAIF